MAYKVFEDYAADVKSTNQSDIVKFSAAGQDHIELPQEGIIQNAELSREGTDLILNSENGETIVIEGYFEASPAPDLIGPNGMRLTADLVESFITSPMEYADAGLSTSDATPIGAIQEITGNATITRANGTVETIGLGTPVFQGDIVETDENGAINIMFIDETTFAVSEDARLSIDEYVFDPATQSGTTNFSVLKGVFVFTSGLIGRDDPDDVMINTPSGSIGIRGTIIAGDVDAGEITVIEGAIVLHDFAGNSITLANQFETARFNSTNNEIEHMGDLNATDVVSKFMSVSTVAADLFSSIADAANDTTQSNAQQGKNTQQQNQETQRNAEDGQDQSPNESSQDTPAEEQKTGETPDNSEETQETKENTQANSSETEVAEVITSEEIARPRVSAIRQAVRDRAENNETQNAEGNTSEISQQATTDINIDDIPPLSQSGPIQTVRALGRAADAFFSGSENTLFSYNFAEEFSNPAAINSFAISPLTSAEFNGAPVFDATTGQLSFSLANVISANSQFSFKVTANTNLGAVSSDFTFNILTENLNTIGAAPNIILNAGTVFNGSHAGGNTIVNGTNVSVFGDNTASIIDVNGSNALIKAGGGNDQIQIGTSGDYKIYGETGDDLFVMNGGSLGALYSNNGQIDGGTGFDNLRIGNAGNLDFSNVTTNFIRNIEQIDFDNGSTNQITLRYSDVIRMTDDNNRLEINLDTGDTLNFVNDAGNGFTNLGIDAPTGFTEFTDGNITLLIDDTQGTVTGL